MAELGRAGVEVGTGLVCLLLLLPCTRCQRRDISLPLPDSPPFLSVFGLLGFTFIYHSLNFDEPLVPDPYRVIFHTMADARFWLLLVMIPVIAVGPRMMAMYVEGNCKGTTGEKASKAPHRRIYAEAKARPGVVRFFPFFGLPQNAPHVLAPPSLRMYHRWFRPTLAQYVAEKSELEDRQHENSSSCNCCSLVCKPW